MSSQANPHDLVRAVLLADYHPVEDTIGIVHEKHSGKDAAFAVAFEDRAGRSRRGIIGPCRHQGRWLSSGGFMGSVRATEPQDVWLTYGGWGPGGAKERAVIGGWVADPAATAARLVDASSGRVLEAEVENGVAIFMWKGDLGLRDARVDLLDAERQVLTTGPVLRASPR